MDSPPRPMIRPTHLSGTVKVNFVVPGAKLASLFRLDWPPLWPSLREPPPLEAMLFSTKVLIAALAALTWESDPRMLATRTPGLLWDSKCDVSQGRGA